MMKVRSMHEVKIAQMAAKVIAQMTAKVFVQLIVEHPEGNDPKDLLMSALANAVHLMQKQDSRNIALLCSTCVNTKPIDHPFEAVKKSVEIAACILVMELDQMDQMDQEAPFIKLLTEIRDKVAGFVSTSSTETVQ